MFQKIIDGALVITLVYLQMVPPLKLMPFLLCALVVNAAPLEQRTARLDQLLEYALEGITNRRVVQCLADKGSIKYFFLITAYAGHKQASNSPLLYMPWRLLQSVDTNDTYHVLAGGSYAEFTKSVSTGKPRGKYGMPGSGFPRGWTNWLSSIDVQLWANKELGECDDIYHLHSDARGTNYVVLISKHGRKWIVLERDHNLSYTGYFDRGDNSYIFGGKNDPDRPPVPGAPKPMVFDEVSKFEDFYGATKAIDTELGKFRIWRKGDFIVSHIDGTPARRVVTVDKVIGGDFNEREAFEIADRYCGKLEWSLEEKDHKWSLSAASPASLLRCAQIAHGPDPPRLAVPLAFALVSFLRSSMQGSSRHIVLSREPVVKSVRPKGSLRLLAFNLPPTHSATFLTSA